MVEPGKIMVFLPNWVGDVVMATAALRALREHFRSAEITYVGRPVALETLSGVGWPDRALADVSTRGVRCVNFFRMAWSLRRERFDLAVLLPNSFRAAALARLARASRIAGYDRDARGWLLTDRLEPMRDEAGRFVPAPMIDYYIALVEMLGAPCRSRRMELAVPDRDAAAAQALCSQAGVQPNDRLVMLNPGASFGTSKIWPAERYASVADSLIDRHGVRIIINAAPAEREIAAAVQRAMRREPAISFAGRDNSIGLVKGLMRRCSLLITNDTGARHIGAALDIGVVTIFGSTDPAWARIDHPRERIVRTDAPCAPCQRKRCRLPAGPGYHQCMGAISPEMVLHAAEELLGEAQEPAR